MTTIPEYAKGGIVSGSDFAPAPDSRKELQPYHIDGVPLPIPPSVTKTGSNARWLYFSYA